MKRLFTIAIASIFVVSANAQGNNTRMGGQDGDYQSLSERIFKLEKKNDAFNVYFNYAASAQASAYDGEWTSHFANKQLRLEIKGNITDKIFYRLRHRMNKMNAAKGEDNFAKATDIMMVGYNVNDKLSIMGGKMCQIWGGFEFDENPMYIYQYSDMVDNMDNFMAGVVVSYKPVPTQEFAVELSDANNGQLNEEYGDFLNTIGPNIELTSVLPANHPLTFIFNWNGSFCDDMLQTRWSWGTQKQAKETSSQMLILGQRLNLPKFQWYIDYMGAWDGMDRLGIATYDAAGIYLSGVHIDPEIVQNVRFKDVNYNSLITKLNWQFAPQWNLMLKGTYETASVKDIDMLDNYRKSIGWAGSLEYYPDKSQDFRVFLAYIGHKYNYDEITGLDSHDTHRIELGFMFRIKAF